MASTPKQSDEITVPSMHNWRTTDSDEINRRRLRAREEQPRIKNTDEAHPIFSNFQVFSPSGLTYSVEIRDVRERQFSCNCVDFRINGLGTCKHVEAVIEHLQARFRKQFAGAVKDGSPRIDIVPAPLRAERGEELLPAPLHDLFDDATPPEEVVECLRDLGLPELRISQDVEPWLASLRNAEERKILRREYEQKVRSGEYPPHETTVPLYPYQREGMLHLAFTERALLADEMGLGKTIQAIAACALLHRLGKAARALIVTPASLKTEWEEQIQRFTPLSYQIVFGPRHKRLEAYAGAPFFTLVNYEQMVGDALDVNARLNPDIVVLDEAQRIKNWSTKTAQAVKRLQSRYAFVLTGTPIENRIDELRSIIDFLDPAIFGPLFRFNREFYSLDERGRPEGYRNLDKMHARIAPVLLRRRKAEVETELPDRVDRVFFVPLSDEQQASYGNHEAQVSRLASAAARRPLTKQEQEKLMRELAMMRMICDTNYILDPEDRVCPKMDELEKIIEELREDADVKIIIFSEWERMLELARDLCRTLKLGFAWHTGSVPQRRRRAEIMMFKSDPACRVFLTTDSGGVGLNLQNASVVINCDLPWNPAKLEQRIARAWRKHQTRTVTVINLVSENTIEHRMLGTISAKQGLADGVLDRIGDIKEIKLKPGGQTFLSKLEQIISKKPVKPAAQAPEPLPVDRSAAFSTKCASLLNGNLVACEERFPNEGAHSVLVVVVERDADVWRERLKQTHDDLFGVGKNDPLAPVQLEVIDRATAGALKRLAEAGLIHPSVRATRHLHPAAEAAAPSTLTDEEKQKIAAARERASRKLKVARLLAAEGLTEEARPALMEALHQLCAMLSVENHLPEPVGFADCLRAPWTSLWGNDRDALQTFESNPQPPPEAMLGWIASFHARCQSCSA